MVVTDQNSSEFLGMDRKTGRKIADMNHIKQSIYDILTTPIGSRLQRREYGSDLANLIDQPFNDLTRQKIFGATAIAIKRWESRVKLLRCDLVADSNEPSKAILSIDFLWKRAGMKDVNISFDVPLSREF